MGAAAVFETAAETPPTKQRSKSVIESQSKTGRNDKFDHIVHLFGMKDALYQISAMTYSRSQQRSPGKILISRDLLFFLLRSGEKASKSAIRGSK